MFFRVVGLVMAGSLFVFSAASAVNCLSHVSDGYKRHNIFDMEGNFLYCWCQADAEPCGRCICESGEEGTDRTACLISSTRCAEKITEDPQLVTSTLVPLDLLIAADFSTAVSSCSALSIGGKQQAHTSKSTTMAGSRSGSMAIADVTLEVALAAHELYAVPDRANRLIAATARALSLPLITADAQIRSSGIVEVIW